MCCRRICLDTEPDKTLHSRMFRGLLTNSDIRYFDSGQSELAPSSMEDGASCDHTLCRRAGMHRVRRPGLGARSGFPDGEADDEADNRHVYPPSCTRYPSRRQRRAMKPVGAGHSHTHPPEHRSARPRMGESVVTVKSRLLCAGTPQGMSSTTGLPPGIRYDGTFADIRGNHPDGYSMPPLRVGSVIRVANPAISDYSLPGRGGPGGVSLLAAQLLQCRWSSAAAGWPRELRAPPASRTRALARRAQQERVSIAASASERGAERSCDERSREEPNRNEPNDMTRHVRVGLLGCGNIGTSASEPTK